ncbi:unnamed protein product [Cladocopium goreaui]|uniref:SET and MYND domain-containing protein DDB_G0292140 n=1 Tax=Cladocopium goreaui TaxID=2562237 RepID=A0A9P1BT38_9DINO|nr:unnamed protein product [Cladocopium goreaui]
MAEDRLIATLDVEPYVGPVRVGYSPERGRGLFVTEDVAKGRLLLCARALVTGLNEDLPSQLVAAAETSAHLMEAVRSLSRGHPESEQKMPALSMAQLAKPEDLPSQLVAAAETSAHLMEAVRSLSRGHPESEQKMPALSMAQLAKPEDLIDGDEPLDQLPLEEARNILYHNQFSLPLVNPNAAPLEVGNDTERSGLWLLPVFVNHSCLPNVQRIIVLDCLFLRAGRDLKEGEELFDGYVETLQPLWHRRESLEAYGFRCSCERCVLEEAIYPEGGARREELRKILEQAAGAVASRTEGAQLAEQMEAVATAADILMDRALAAALQEGVVPSTSIYQVPSVALSAQRMAMIRGGFERASDEEVFDFQRQDALQALLLGSVANVLRGYALSLRGLNRYVEAAGAWQRALDALDQVIPGSELGAIVANDMLSNKLLAFHLDHKQAAKKEMRSALLRSHWAYSGGAETWRHFSDKLFAPSVLDGGIAAWKTLQAEDPKLDTGGYQALPETVPAVPAKEKPGFEDLLRKRAAQRGKKSHEMRTPETTSDVAKPAQRTENQKSQGKEAFPPSDGTGPSAGGGASCEVTTAVEDGVEQVTCVVNLPGLSSATEANLEVSESELRVTSLRADMPHVVCATLPLCVDPNSSRARWSKRHQQLTAASMFHLLNVLDYAGFVGSSGVRKNKTIRHARGRFVNQTSSLLKESPQCEDKVKSACLFAKENQPYPEVPAGSVRPVGGFRTEAMAQAEVDQLGDLVAHEQSRWVGRVAEALYNVEAAANRRAVDMCKSQNVVPAAAAPVAEHWESASFRCHAVLLQMWYLGGCRKVCSEGHSMLDAVEKGCNQTSWQVEAGAKVWRQVFPDDFPSTTLAGFVSFFTRERTNETMYSPEAAVMGGCGVAKQPRIGGRQDDVPVPSSEIERLRRVSAIVVTLTSILYIVDNRGRMPRRRAAQGVGGRISTVLGEYTGFFFGVLGTMGCWYGRYSFDLPLIFHCEDFVPWPLARTCVQVGVLRCSSTRTNFLVLSVLMLFLILCPVAASLVDGPGVGRVGDFRKRVDEPMSSIPNANLGVPPLLLKARSESLGGERINDFIPWTAMRRSLNALLFNVRKRSSTLGLTGSIRVRLKKGPLIR